MRMQGYCDVYKWTILKRTSPEVKCLHLTSSRREMCTLSVSNVIYHKFSHGAAFYTLNGKNVNVMLEYRIKRPTHMTHNTTFFHAKFLIMHLNENHLQQVNSVNLYPRRSGSGMFKVHFKLDNILFTCY